VLPAPPVVLDGLYVPDDVRVEPPVEGVLGVGVAPGAGLEQVTDPVTALGEAAPQAVGMHLDGVKENTLNTNIDQVQELNKSLNMPCIMRK
jgi:hypothetical protein